MPRLESEQKLAGGLFGAHCRLYLSRPSRMISLVGPKCDPLANAGVTGEALAPSAYHGDRDCLPHPGGWSTSPCTAGATGTCMPTHMLLASCFSALQLLQLHLTRFELTEVRGLSFVDFLELNWNAPLLIVLLGS